MVKLLINLAIAGWIFASAFVLTHSPVTAWNSMIVAVAVAAAALMAFSAVGRPGTKWILAGLSIWLFASTMILPHESLGTVLHDALAATVLAFVTLLPSKRWTTTLENDATHPA